MSKLTKRLELICNLVKGKNIADVGCDHGKLTLELFNKNVIDFAYVSDISQNSLNKAINLLNKNNCKFKAICCDGLQGYEENNIDECIIAGMGGYEIMQIIKNAKVYIPSFILAPQHDNIELKKFLIENNFQIIFDIIILDKGKFYNIIKCNKTNKICKLSEFDLYFGKDNFKNILSDIDKYVYKYLKMYNEIKSKKKDVGDKLNNLIGLFEKAKKEIEYEQNNRISKS